MQQLWTWENYSGVPPCIELNATFDDLIKKDDAFINYAMAVAKAILLTHPDRGIRQLSPL